MPSFIGRINGGRILLNVFVGPAGTPPTSGVVALVDTGATISGVTPGLVERRGLANTGEWMRLGGVHGSQDVAAYEVALGLPISDHPGEPAFIRGHTSVKVAELALPEPSGFEVLLGMDFLNPFHLTVYREVFILSNRPAHRK